MDNLYASIYKEELLDHYRNPRNSGVIEQADISTESGNPACGDSVSFYIKLNGNTINQIKFLGHGCVISQATASMLTEKVLNKNLTDIMNYSKETILELIKIPLGPTRLRCALLSLESLQNGIKDFLRHERD